MTITGQAASWKCGYPKKVDSNHAAKDDKIARKLGAVSEELTAVSYNWYLQEVTATA